MLLKSKHLLTALFLSTSTLGFAQDDANYPVNPNNANVSVPVSGGGSQQQSDQEVAVYLQNLGKYFGYDLTQYCTSGGPCTSPNMGTGTGNEGGAANSNQGGDYSNTLLNENNVLITQLALYDTVLGALLGQPGSSGSNNSTSLVPSSLPSFQVLNTLASQTFASPAYSSPSAQGITANPLIDQQTLQADPVSQGVLNILGTPDGSYCQTNDQSSWVGNCNYLYRDLVMLNVLGTIPKTDTYFTYDYIQSFLPQLNANVLMTPLMYSTTSLGGETTSSTTTSGSNQGLTAANQAQQAANFIRYATSMVNPVAQPTRNVYDTLYSQAMNLSGKVDSNTQHQAQLKLTNYLTRTRSYAAIGSVGISNMYYILSKRVAQSTAGNNNSSSSNNTTSSQALNEFNMATWRLFNPNSTSNSSTQTQWVSQINQGSAATVQKEIAILLAEINYQLYLNRQQQERQLLTETMLLLQNMQSAQPQTNISEAPTS